VHATSEFSRRQFAASPDATGRALLAALRRATRRRSPAVLHCEVQRWQYAQPAAAVPPGERRDHARGITAAG
jgi:predicted NAD/FAD-dependent oxidoreductase